MEYTFLSTADFYLDLEHVITGSIKRCYPYEWDEDHITRDILRNLRDKFRLMQCRGWGYNLTAMWEAYKFTGKAEYSYGDVAVIVNLVYDDGVKLEGVGFLEAKKRTPNTNKFEAVELEQIKRIKQSALGAMVLLYDNYPISKNSPTWDLHNYMNLVTAEVPKLHYLEYARSSHDFPTTQAVVVPTSLITDKLLIDTKLYRHALPLSYQICCRYFLGLDLHYDEGMVEMAKGFAGKRGYPRYIMTLSIGHNIPYYRLSMPKINQDIYTVI